MPGREKSARHKGTITARLPELASALRVVHYHLLVRLAVRVLNPAMRQFSLHTPSPHDFRLVTVTPCKDVTFDTHHQG